MTGLAHSACFDVDPTRQLLLVPQVKPKEVAVILLDAIPLGDG